MMMNKGSGIYLLIALLLLFLIIDIGLATWVLAPPLTRQYIVQPDETVADIANKYHLHEQVIVQSNDLRPGNLVQPGQVLSIRVTPLTPFLDWQLQLVGLAGTLVGVLISFWVCHLSGLLPRGLGGRVISLSLAVAVVNYVIIQASSSAMPAAITPLFVLNSVKDGFAWSTGLLLLAKALGIGSAQG